MGWSTSFGQHSRRHPVDDGDQLAQVQPTTNFSRQIFGRILQLQARRFGRHLSSPLLTNHFRDELKPRRDFEPRPARSFIADSTCLRHSRHLRYLFQRGQQQEETGLLFCLLSSKLTFNSLFKRRGMFDHRLRHLTFLLTFKLAVFKLFS